MELLTVNAIRKIEEESHLSGVTDRIKSYLEENGAKVVPQAAPTGEQ